MIRFVRQQQRSSRLLSTFFERQQQQDHISEKWNSANAYDRTFGEKFKAFADAAFSFCPVPPRVVLDVGCGSGAMFDVLSKQQGTLDSKDVDQYVGIDFATNMIQKCLEKRDLLEARRSCSAQFQFYKMNGTQLDFPPDTFDAAFGLFSVLFFDDRSKGLAEMNRVVSKGGHVVVSGWCKDVEW